MIHDLSKDRIFSKKDDLQINVGFLESVNFKQFSDFHSYEALYTGNAIERNEKRFYQDYENEKNLCDRCGCQINRPKWDFSTGKLCKNCEEKLEKQINSSQIRVNGFSKKAWDIEPFPDHKPTEDIFLWD